MFSLPPSNSCILYPPPPAVYAVIRQEASAALSAYPGHPESSVSLTLIGVLVQTELPPASKLHLQVGVALAALRLRRHRRTVRLVRDKRVAAVPLFPIQIHRRVTLLNPDLRDGAKAAKHLPEVLPRHGRRQTVHVDHLPADGVPLVSQLLLSPPLLSPLLLPSAPLPLSLLALSAALGASVLAAARRSPAAGPALGAAQGGAAPTAGRATPGQTPPQLRPVGARRHGRCYRRAERRSRGITSHKHKQ